MAEASDHRESLASLIRTIRGVRVMLDADLARLYGVEAKQLKRQVRRNRERFPGDFVFVLTHEENESLRCQIGTLKTRGAHAKYLPFAFTEQGVAMLSSVLNSPRAIQVNIAIVRAFVRLREVVALHKDVARQLEVIDRQLAKHEGRLDDQARQIRIVFEAIRQLMEPPAVRHKPIGFRPP